MKKITRCLAAIAAVLYMAAGVSAYAAEDVKIVEFKAGEGQIRAFAKNVDSVNEVGATLGKLASEDVQYQTVADAGLEMRTLILIDNSFSIPETERASIREWLLEIAAARRSGDRFAVGTVAEQVTILLDFTDDYTAIKEAVDSLEYQDQETYLTDALYDYLAEKPFSENWESYERILLISDGVDNKSIGYTRDELEGLLRETPTPIYAVGVGNGRKGNNEELENMFALARSSNGEGLLLNDAAEQLAGVLAADWNNLVVTVQIPEAAQDGSLQTLSLAFHGADGRVTASVDNIRMPLLVMDQAPAEAPGKTQDPAAGPKEEEGILNKGEEKPTAAPAPEELPMAPEIPFLAVAVSAGGVSLVILIAIVFLLRKRKKAAEAVSHDRFEAPGKIQKPTGDVLVGNVHKETGEEYATSLVEDADGDDDDKTFRLWGRDEICRVTLTDVHAPEHFYQKAIDTALTIGASRESDICINYDRTVSRKHCEIIREGEDLFLVNHSQSNGTLLNGTRVTSKVPLVSGSIIKMGRVEIRIEIGD